MLLEYSIMSLTIDLYSLVKISLIRLLKVCVSTPINKFALAV